MKHYYTFIQCQNFTVDTVIFHLLGQSNLFISCIVHYYKKKVGHSKNKNTQKQTLIFHVGFPFTEVRERKEVNM